MWRWFLCGSLLGLFPVAASAQGSAPVHPVYKRAQTLVNDGNAAAGRALVDSMIAVAAPGSNDYAEGIFWRAVLAPTAAEAEMDYRRVVVDFPTSPRVEDALIRLAQLEIARANYDGALRHLNRLAAEHPESPARARAGYWMARALFEKNDIQGGCAAVADALARTSENDAELRNQITYLNQRCAGVVLAAPGPATQSPVPTMPTPAAPVASTTVTGGQIPPSPRDSASTPRPITATRDTVPVRPVSPPAAPAVSLPAPPPVSPPAPPAPPAARPTTELPKPAAPPPPAPVSERDRVYSVQVAAFNVKSQADAMVARLKKSGYEARVDGTAAPFRVRIGKYATQAQASAVQRSLKAKQIAGFVVQADIR